MKTKIVVVDTDHGFVQRLKKKIDDEGVNDRYEVVPLVPDTTLNDADLAERVTNSVASIEGLVGGVFVDIVIYEKGKLDTAGYEIGRRIRERLSDLPLFYITGKIRGEQEEQVFSAATLEDVEGVFSKEFIDGEQASSARLRNILSRGAEKRRRLGSNRRLEGSVPVLPDKGINIIKENFGVADKSLDPLLASIISDIGEGKFWSLLGGVLEGAQGSVSYMKQGRSGAYVVKVVSKFAGSGDSMTTRPKAWLLKFDKDERSLQRQIESYKEIRRTPLSRAKYPALLHEEVYSYSDWSVIALELESDVRTLKDEFCSRYSEAKGETLSEELIGSLVDIYGDRRKRIVSIWSSAFSLSGKANAPILAFLTEFSPILQERIDKEKIRRIEQLVYTDGATERALLNYSTELEEGLLHGDLNCDNILIRPEGGLVLIDFAPRSPDFVLKDIAKLERDLIFKIADAGTSRFYDWNRIEEWKSFLSTLDGENFLEYSADGLGCGRNTQEVLAFIYALRSKFSDTGIVFERRNYLVALLFFALLGLAHPGVSIQKKAFAIIYLDRILDELERF